MTLRHLNIFITVCDCGSITAASKKLFISQPSVSSAIKELESYYGIKLFDRISKRLFITELGKQMLEQARHLVYLYDSMESGIKGWETGGVLRVGSSITIGNCFLPVYVKEFSERYNNIKLRVSINSSEKIENMIMENELDVALIEGVPHYKKINSEVFMNDELVIVCPKGHPLSASGKISLEQLVACDLILRERGSGTRELFDDTLLIHDALAEPIWESVSTQAIINAVKSGLGLSVLPYKLVEEELRRNNICRLAIEEIEFKRNYYIIRHSDKYVSRPMSDFMDICQGRTAP